MWSKFDNVTPLKERKFFFVLLKSILRKLRRNIYIFTKLDKVDFLQMIYNDIDGRIKKQWRRLGDVNANYIERNTTFKEIHKILIY